MSEILRVEGLTRAFGDLRAVEDVSFTVERGALFAFLGPNGAGKSTTIAMLIGLLKPTAGTITYEFQGASGTVVGRDDRTLKRNLGVVFQESLLDPNLTVRTNLRSRAQFYRLGLDGLDTVAEVLRLNELMSRPYGELSGGQRRRVDIARALINSPQILFLDEPTTGLDPQSRRLVWKTLRELQDELDMTIFLTTHYMEEADDADQLQIIDHGSLVAGGSPAELKTKHSESRLRVKADHDVLELFTRHGIAATHRDGLVEAAIPDPRVALDFLAENKAHFIDFEFVHGTMDDVFLSLTGNALRED